jgi:adhesin/invasin
LFGGNSTITVTTDANGQASVNADANTTAGSYAVTATVGSLSVNFALTNVAGPIAAVQFRIQPPTNVGTGQRFRAQVVLLDQYGNVVRRPNTGVRLSLRAGSGLSGTLVKRTSIHGLATFGDLVLSTPGRYRLVARLGNGLQVISRAITVI